IDHFFFETTREVDWKDWAKAQAIQYLETHGIHLAEGRALGDLEQIAEDNGRDAQDLLNQYQREMATPLIRDTKLSVEFRAAVTALSRALLIPDAVTPTTEEVLLGWLAGRSVPGAMSALKKVQIFERINVGNARAMLISFCRWLGHTGHAGLVVTLDFQPYEYKKVAKARRQAEQLKRVREAIERGAGAEELEALAAESAQAEPEAVYSDAAYMQMLTIIRRFIDEIGLFDRFLLVILTTPNFYKDKTLDPQVKRSYFDYDALQTRIGQEVHDAKRANPAAALAYLEETE
ncbi:MAG: BREX system ATP-binding domain-containing protein, partial [Capsulimonas sp.]|uniref:BREX system ATP-binding domain-containing protein n=1 Tax=Capsulimonas sp. TaxID=2494211 RepID=UPI0032637DB2